MARRCHVTGLGNVSGNKRSHSLRASRRTWKANLRTVRALVNGTPKKMTVCSRCLRSGLVERA